LTKQATRKGEAPIVLATRDRLIDKKEIDRITNKLMNKIIIPTETMDTVATMTSKQIKSKCNTEIHEHIRHQNLVNKILNVNTYN